MASASAQGAAILCEFTGGGDFPFRLCGQPALRPITVGLSFKPAYVNYRIAFPERHIAVENALLPAAVRVTTPVNGVIESFSESFDFCGLMQVFVEKLSKGALELRRAAALQPFPPVGAPKFRFAVAAVLHEGAKFAVCNGGAGDAKGDDRNRMRPFFVVKDERKIGCRSDQENSAGNIHVAARNEAGMIVRS